MAGSIATRFSALIYHESYLNAEIPSQKDIKSQAIALAQLLATDPDDDLFPPQEKDQILEHMFITQCSELAPGIRLTLEGFRALCVASILHHQIDLLQFLLETENLKVDLSEVLAEAIQLNNGTAKNIFSILKY